MGNRKLSLMNKWFLFLWVLVGCFQITWASDIEIQPSAGIRGIYRYDRYIPIKVDVTNTGSDFKGEVQILLGGGSIAYSQAINISADTSQTIRIPIDTVNQNYQSALVKVVDDKHKEVAQKKVYFSGTRPDNHLIGLISDNTSVLDYFGSMILNLGYEKQTYIMELDTSFIDEKVKNIDMYDYIILDDFDTSQLLPEQLSALKEWISNGGVLVVGTGVNGNKTLSGLTGEILPVQPREYKNQEVEILHQPIKLDLMDLEPIEGEAILEEAKKPQMNSYNSLYEVFALGTGKIIVAKYALGLEPMASFEGNQAMWREIFEHTAPISSIQRGDYYSLNYHLSGILNSNLPSATVLAVIILIYLVIIGIVTYIVLRKRGKKEYIWLVAPVLALVTTLGLYGFSMGSRLAPFVVNQIDVIHVNQNGNASKVSNTGIINAGGLDLNINESEDRKFSYVGNTENIYRNNNNDDTIQKTTHFIRYEGDKIHYTMTDCGIYDTTLVITEPKNCLKPNYEVQLKIKNGEYVVDFTNSSDQKVEVLLVKMGTQFWDLGELEVGDHVNYTLSSSTSYRDMYALFNRYNDESKEPKLDLLNAINDTYFSYYDAVPTLIAVTESNNDIEPLVTKEYSVGSHYEVTIQEMNLNLEEKGDVIFPYDYFRPRVAEEKVNGKGYVDYNSPVLTISGDYVAVLDYEIELSEGCQLDWIDIGYNEDAMINYYYNNLKGQVSIYNFTKEAYEPIEVRSLRAHRLEGDALKDYCKDGAIRLQVEGSNEDCGLVPSIRVGGHN